MQPNKTIKRIAYKEMQLFFSSPIAYLFLAAFAAVTLFTFFWAEAFFSRNIADVRPLFEWLPLLLIFLASTLTMRLWSEERRTGTLEHVLTQPVPLWHFVVGKFLGCVALLSIALLITLPLPITVTILGKLDWGPVISGYLATLLLGSAYISIGLFVSARSENQIVSLISAVALCGIFYGIGSKTITDFFGNHVGEWLRLLGVGSRFESITRGVIDVRDLYYYLSIIAVFLVLNTFALERERWALSNNKNKDIHTAEKQNSYHQQHHTAWKTLTTLLILNALTANIWLAQVNNLRIDTTAGNQYSLSPATKSYLQQLQEPLLLRGYFSNKTHPLLSPLVPQLRDLMNEYQVAGKGKVRVEIIDPVASPELEEEASKKYAIQAVPFQVSDRYQAAVVNSYFNVLVQYGDEYKVLSFRDLIEVKSGGQEQIDVKLRNPEHDLTRAIKKVLHGYQAGGNLFDTVKGKLVFNAYISAESQLPQQLKTFKTLIQDELKKQQTKASGQLDVNFIDPAADGGKIGEKISKDYGFNPMAINLLSNQRFYFYLTLEKNGQMVQIPLDDLTNTSFERNLASAVKRFATGFTKTVAFVTPEPTPNPYGPHQGGVEFNQLQQFLGAELNIQPEDLSDGSVSAQADILFLAAPKNFDEKKVFAVDQFLMQGGTVIAVTSPYAAEMSQRSLALQKHSSGLNDWLLHQGIRIEEKLVMDKKNVPFPVPVTRNLGGFSVQEMRMLDYPYFIDVRDDGLNLQNPITSNLPQVTMAWASPIVLDAEKNKSRTITELMHSSPKSWLTANTQVMPQVSNNGVTPYLPEGETKAHLLGAITQGRFNSFFSGKESPLLTPENKSDGNKVYPVIERSPESARIIVFSSNDFLTDPVVSMAGAASGGQYLNSLQLMANSFDWSLEDAGLLTIRSRSHFNRTLPTLEQSTQMFWEYLNYGLALLALVVVGLVQHQLKRAREKQYQLWLAN
jgi:ABC-2 type transport system permease protein